MSEQEIWVDVPNYEGLYQVSNLGNVKSLFRRNKNRVNQEKLMKFKLNSSGYYQVWLCKNNYDKGFFVHRLVALAFIPNENNLSEVNHIDAIKTNNVVSNLEWCSHTDNMKHANKLGLISTKEMTESKRKYTKIDLDKVLELRAANKSHIQISKDTGIHKSTVKRMVDKKYNYL